MTAPVATVDVDLVSRVRTRLSADGRAVLSPGRVAAALRAEGAVLGDAALLQVVATLTHELAGLGLLQALVDDPAVTDVLVNAPDDVWVERGGRLVRTEVRFVDDQAVRALAQRLVAAAGRRVDDAAPFADVALPGDVRLHVALAPVATRGTSVSLRVARRRALTLAELVASGSLGADAAAVLDALVRARVSLLVTGGAGAGKTTMLATLLGAVPAAERVVVVEDSAELRPRHPHVVLLEGRPANVEGAGRVDLRELVRQALRKRPDRLVVGEVRGPEVVDLLAALNTGHDGGFGTLHANRVVDVPARLEALALPAGLGRAAVHAQVAAGLGAVVHLEREVTGARCAAELGVPRTGPDGLVSMAVAADLRGRGLRWTAAGAGLREQLDLST